MSHRRSQHIETLRRRVTQAAMRLCFRRGAPPLRSIDRLPRSGIHRILICRSVRTLGDSLTLTPLLQAVRNAWPGAEIDLVSRCPVATEIYGAYFQIGRIIPLPVHAPGHPIRTLRVLQRMRNVHYDLAIDPDPHSQSGRLLILLARKQRSLGFSGPRKSGTLTHTVDPAGGPRNHAQQPVYLLRCALGEDATERAYPRLDIRLGATELQAARDALQHLLAKQPGKVRGCIGLFTDATGDKCFDAAWWKRFISEFAPAVSDYAIVEILSAAGHAHLDPCYPSFYSGNPRKLAAVLANLAFFISADCGVMHLASAAGVPTAGIFKVTDPAEWGPYGGANLALDARGLTAEHAAAKVLSAFRAVAVIRGPPARDRVD